MRFVCAEKDLFATKVIPTILILQPQEDYFVPPEKFFGNYFPDFINVYLKRRWVIHQTHIHKRCGNFITFFEMLFGEINYLDLAARGTHRSA